MRDVTTSNLTGAGGGTTGTTGTTGAAQMAVCPPRQSTGFTPSGGGTIPNAKPGPLPGTWVGPTLTFDGILNPGIPTTIPITNTILNTTPTQVQIAPAAAQTTTTTTAGGTATTGTGVTIG